MSFELAGFVSEGAARVDLVSLAVGFKHRWATRRPMERAFRSLISFRWGRGRIRSSLIASKPFWAKPRPDVFSLCSVALWKQLFVLHGLIAVPHDSPTAEEILLEHDSDRSFHFPNVVVQWIPYCYSSSDSKAWLALTSSTYHTRNSVTFSLNVDRKLKETLLKCKPVL